MFPEYTAIKDTDVEKQPLVSDYQHGHPCQCGRQQQQRQDQDRRTRPSKSTIAIFVLILLLFVGYGHNICQNKHDHYYHPAYTNNDQQQQQAFEASSSLFSDLKYCYHHSPLDVHWNGKSAFELGPEITSLSVEQKHDGHRLSAQAGDVVVVENKKINETKVTFDIRLNDDRSQDAVRIDESWSKHALDLTVVTNDYDIGNGCVKIDVLIEVPSSAALDALTIKFINNDITIKDKLHLKDFVSASVVSGDLTVKKPLTSPKISFSLASGDITGVFDVDQVEFGAASTSGDVDLDFNRISSASTIRASTVSGDVNLRLPSDFDSKFDLSVVAGDVKLKAEDAKKLHYRRSGGIVGRKVNGYYGEDENPSSHIKLDTVSGNLELKYQ
ncbi:hypothetical protein BCR42DRAFT_413492 [Absidia repens]|uniref:DUF4097 domain-containing protein n=1 Tax=Absidia repens TaxID=90262 RepID=A0A1X2IHZ5_9FUNG|nr:hypothetical protein BCR42DRAFT_413492 [Absidia repens]